MAGRTLRRLLSRAVWSLLGIVLVASCSFVLARLAPGDFTATLDRAAYDVDAQAAQRAIYGLDRPLATQYLDWASRLIRLDLGSSFLYGRPVSTLVIERGANTARLAGAALLIAFGIGMPLGTIVGARQRSRLTWPIEALSILTLSVPPLLLAIALGVVASRAGLLLDESVWWPALAVGLPMAAAVERLQAQALARVLGEPFVVNVRARGVSPMRVLWYHAARPATASLLSVFAVLAASVLSGAFGVEVVTAWPGLGQLTFEALAARDVNLVAGCTVFGAVLVACTGIVTDALEPAMDPRVRERP